MTFIQSRRCPCKECIFKGPLGSLPPPKSSYDKTPVNFPTVEPFVAKYTEENLQWIPRTILEAQVPPSDSFCEKLLNARSPDIYPGKSHMECYNFYQQCEDHFTTARAKGPNRISFAASFLRDRINFRWQQYKQKHEAESSVSIT